MSEPQGKAGWWRVAGAIARRDLLEFVRDRRTLFVTLLMPMAMYPVLALSSLLGVRTALDDTKPAEPPTRLVLAVSGADAPAFVARVRGLPAAVAATPDWPEHLDIEALRAGDARRLRDEAKLDAWIDLAPGAVAGLDATGTVALEVRLPDAEVTGRRVREHVTAVLRGLADDARRRRVAAAGLPPSVLAPVTFSFVGGAEVAAGVALRGVVPLAAGAVLVLLALLMATGAFYPAIDAIAGEKERGTIETLLMAPCGPGELVFGKFLAVLGVTLATLAANVVSIGLTLTVLLRFLPAGAALGLSAGVLTSTLVIALPAFVGLAAVAAAMSLAVTAASKSVKEAQNTLTPVILLVSGLAGAALLPGVGERPWLAAVPFSGQVAVTRAVLLAADAPPTRQPADPQAVPPSSALPLGSLAITLVSSAFITWLLLRATAAVVTDEEILFRGPDAATAGFARPAPRPRPTAWQGFGAVLAGFALLWYVQGLAPADLPRAILFQQAAAVLAPLAAVAWWQRVDARTTFALRRPGAGPVGSGLALLGAALTGGGLFVLGAAALLTVRGDGLSPEAEALSRRLVTFMREAAWWQSAALIALVPAVAEELFFRGWVLSSFAGERPPRGRAVAATAGQAAMFALFHLLPERMPQTFVLGLVLGWMTLRSRSILPAVVGHVAHNAMPLVLLGLVGDTAFEPEALATAAARLPGWSVGAAGLAFVAGVALFLTSARRPGDAGPSP